MCDSPTQTFKIHVRGRLMTKNLGTPNINQSKETKISPYKIKNNSF